MTGEPRPLLFFGPPTVAQRPSQRSRGMPGLSKPAAERQGERLTPQFRKLVNAFAAERARLGTDTPDEVDPSLVVMLDLAGSVKDFRNAINHINGLEFLSELLGDRAEPDDDFHMVDQEESRTDKPVTHSLYLVMSNARAVEELLRLFTVWQGDPPAPVPGGLGEVKRGVPPVCAHPGWGGGGIAGIVHGVAGEPIGHVRARTGQVQERLPAVDRNPVLGTRRSHPRDWSARALARNARPFCRNYFLSKFDSTVAICPPSFTLL